MKYLLSYCDENEELVEVLINAASDDEAKETAFKAVGNDQFMVCEL